MTNSQRLLQNYGYKLITENDHEEVYMNVRNLSLFIRFDKVENQIELGDNNCLSISLIKVINERIEELRELRAEDD